MCKDFKCGKSFSQEQSLKIHNHVIHEGHKDIKCEFCGNSLSEEGTLEKHIHRIHEARKDHKYKYCDNFFSEGNKCGKCFTQNIGLKTHISAVHEKEKLQCEICFKEISTKSNLITHITNIHGRKKR